MIDWYLTSIAGGLLGAFLWQVGTLVCRGLQKRHAGHVEAQERRLNSRIEFIKAVAEIKNLAAGRVVGAGEVESVAKEEIKSKQRKAWPAK